MDWRLNDRAAELVLKLPQMTSDLRIQKSEVAGATVYDFGINTEGGLQAGFKLAQLCMSGLAEVSLTTTNLNEAAWPAVQVSTDHPLAACLLSQYAGWQIGIGKYFAMGSGPMRAAVGRESVFQKFQYQESPSQTVGILEGRKLPTPEVLTFISEKTGIPADKTTLCIAPTASQAGTVQVVARVVETALHKLFELGFEIRRIVSAHGIAPLSTIAKDDLTAIGRTNDAILYGGQVTLWVRGDDQSLSEIGPHVPANGSPSYGRPFLEIFEAAGRDFYKIDPHLFSPARISFQNLDTGKVQTFGQLNHGVLQQSFGI